MASMCSETLRILALATLSSGVAMAVSLVIGLALLEVPFSLPFAVILGIVLVVLGVLLLVNMAMARFGPPANTSKAAPGGGRVCSGSCANRCGTAMEIAVLTLIALLTIAGGAFSMWLFFQAASLPAAARIAMFTTLGASMTVIISVNLLDLVELCLRCCSEPRSMGPFHVPAPRRRLFKAPAQNWIVIFAALATGVYYGYMYSNIATLALRNTPPGARYSPWADVQRFLEFSLPVAGAVGFLAVAVALMLPLVTSQNPAAAARRPSKFVGGSGSPSNGGNGGTGGGGGSNPAFGRPPVPASPADAAAKKNDDVDQPLIGGAQPRV